MLGAGAADINALLRRALHVEPNEHLAKLAQVVIDIGMTFRCNALQLGVLHAVERLRKPARCPLSITVQRLAAQLQRVALRT